jgi:GNAT superfamily N-acetyltransferase
MSRFEICVFDPQMAAPELWASFHACRRTNNEELWPGEPELSDAEVEFELRRADPLHDTMRWVAVAGQEVIGSARASFRRPGTPDAAAHAPHLYAGGAVRAEARRQGAGAALLREVLKLMHSLDKTVLTLSAVIEPGHAFLTQTGAVPKLTTVTSKAIFKELDWVRLGQWEAAAKNRGLQWERYAGRVPREVLLALLPDFTALFADVPLGGLEIPSPQWEIEGFDRLYETFGRTGGAHHLIVLRDPGGAVAGLTEATWDARMPSLAGQGLTAIARPWRGLGLAKAIKAALLRQVRDNHPEVEAIATGNGEMNAAMRSINVAAGFKPHRNFVEYQVTRDALDLWSSAQPPSELFIM